MEKEILKSIKQYRQLTKLPKNTVELNRFRTYIFNRIYYFCKENNITYRTVSIGNISGEDTYFKIDGVKYDC